MEKETTETITISKEELSKLIASEVKKANTPDNAIRKKRVEEHFTNLTKYDGKYIVDIEDKNIVILNDRKEEELYVNVFFLGEEKKKLLKWEDIRSSEKVDVKILEKKTVVNEIIGQPIPQVKHEDFKSYETGNVVENVVEIPSSTFKVLLPEGNEITVKENVIRL